MNCFGLSRSTFSSSSSSFFFFFSFFFFCDVWFIRQEDWCIPSFKAIVYSVSWVRTPENTNGE